MCAAKPASGWPLAVAPPLPPLRTLQRGSRRVLLRAVLLRFDPHRHQAMAAVPSDAEPNSVVSRMQKGYALHDRILRPALVTVAQPPVEKPARNPISDADLD